MFFFWRPPPLPYLMVWMTAPEKKFFSALWASVWSKHKEERAPGAPPLDPPLLCSCYFHASLFALFMALISNLVPRTLFSGLEVGGPTSKAGEKRPGDEVS